MTRVETFDREKFAPLIEEVVSSFDKYLDEYRPKSYRSKHALMGPVGKVLQEALAGTDDANALAGKALRIHEMNTASGYISDSARQNLEEGTKKLVELCRAVPVTAVEKVVDRIDYGIYYLRRKKGAERRERIRQDYIAFLKQRYPSDVDLAGAWGKDEGFSFEDVRFPSRAAFEHAKGTEKRDMQDFVKQAELKGYKIEEEEMAE